MRPRGLFPTKDTSVTRVSSPCPGNGSFQGGRVPIPISRHVTSSLSLSLNARNPELYRPILFSPGTGSYALDFTCPLHPSTLTQRVDLKRLTSETSTKGRFHHPFRRVHLRPTPPFPSSLSLSVSLSSSVFPHLSPSVSFTVSVELGGCTVISPGIQRIPGLDSHYQLRLTVELT